MHKPLIIPRDRYWPSSAVLAHLDQGRASYSRITWKANSQNPEGEASAWLSDESYNALRHRLEDAHASVEAAAVQARRRVRLNEGRER